MGHTSTQPLIDAWRWFARAAQAPIQRPISQWVEEEIILPKGPYAGEPYRHRRHPASRLWFAALESGKWNRFAATGPTQNGKTLMCYALPVLYHLFEIGETVIIGLPSMDMANDKWETDFRPVIEASRYRDLLPNRGEGSRGGLVRRSIRFQNGADLRFMSAGGSDKKRAGYTSRVVAITETDGMDSSGKASREADKIEQIEARTRAYGRRKRAYYECTTSIEEGRIWQEITRGTGSRIARPCPHCRAWVSPEREHLIGWQEATSEDEAAELASWSCPECAKRWTNEERRVAGLAAVLVHRGQEVTPDGLVVGPEPRTQTLGFRWGAIDNPFWDAADLGREEWLARRARDRENAERKQCQFVFAIPYQPPSVQLTPLDAETVQDRVAPLKKGIVPPNCLGIAVGIDTGKRALHWVVMAVRESGNHVLDYGLQDVDSDRLGVKRALVEALRNLMGYLENGWHSQRGQLYRPDQVWIDSGYHEHQEAVYSLCQQMANGVEPGQERYRPSKGFGEGQMRIGRYVPPGNRRSDIVFTGTQYHLAKVRKQGRLLAGLSLCEINADFWKSELHQRLSMPEDEPGAISLYTAADSFEHSTFAAHITAERQVEKFLPGRGTVIAWERVDRNNHYLDASYQALAASDFVQQLAATRVETEKSKSGGGWYTRQKKRSSSV